MEALQMIIDSVWPMVEANKQFSSAIMLLGSFRLIAKPLMDMYRAYVKWSESKEDDAQLAKWENSPTYKIGCWMINYIFSVKVGSQAVQQAEPAAAPVDEKKS